MTTTSPTLTIHRLSPDRFTTALTSHSPMALRYALQTALGTGSLTLRYEDAVVVQILAGEYIVTIPGADLTTEELGLLSFLTARKFAQVNSIPVDSIRRVIRTRG